jgi:hypothetical protein
MALNLRREALAEIDRKHQTRGFAHDKEIQAAGIEARESEGLLSRKARSADIRAGITADKEIAAERIKADDRRFKKEIEIATKRAGWEKDKNRNNAIKLASEGFQTLPLDEAISQANALLSDHGLTVRKYKKSEGRSGIPVLGWFSEDPEWGYEFFKIGEGGGTAMSSGLLAAAGSKSGESDAARLLRQANERAGEKTKPKDVAPKTYAGTESKQRSGLLASRQTAQPSGGGKAPESRLPADPSTWKVKRAGGNYFVLINDEYVEMTPEEIERWIKASETPTGKLLSESGAAEKIRKSVKTTRPDQKTGNF